MELGTPKARLIEFVKAVGLGQTAFEDKVGLSRGAISKMTDDSTITGKVINKIKEHYYNVNYNWLLTGEGEMFVDTKKALIKSEELVAQLAFNRVVLREIAKLKEKVFGNNASSHIAELNQNIDLQLDELLQSLKKDDK